MRREPACIALAGTEGDEDLVSVGTAIGRAIRQLGEDKAIFDLADEAMTEAELASSPFAEGALLVTAGEAVRSEA